MASWWQYWIFSHSATECNLWWLSGCPEIEGVALMTMWTDWGHSQRDCWRFAKNCCITSKCHRVFVNERNSGRLHSPRFVLVIFLKNRRGCWGHFCLCRRQQICDFGGFVTVDCCTIRNRLHVIASLNSFNHRLIADWFRPTLMTGLVNHLILQQKHNWSDTKAGSVWQNVKNFSNIASWVKDCVLWGISVISTFTINVTCI